MNLNHKASFIFLLVALSFQTVLSSSRETKSLLPLLSDVNVLVVTDTHSWVAGHGKHEPQMNADYGDVLSFHERLSAICASQQKDLFFVMNGDFMHGTGLTSDPPKYLTPILKKMPWDAINIGNHELYASSTIDFISRQGGFVDFWGGKYITSNTIHSETNSSIGVRYRFLEGSYSSTRILTFGFLYNMQDPCPAAEVEKVQEVVQSPWFTNVLKGVDGNFDAILVLAHMDAGDPLVSVILDRIREVCGSDMPVQFITGHTHIRKYETLDEYSTSFEAGRYLDTLGFASFSLPSSSKNKHTPNTFSSEEILSEGANFQYMYIDTNIANFKQVLGGIEELETKSGKELSTFIEQTRQSMGLLEIVGCSPTFYGLYSGLDESDSLWGLYAKEVVPSQLLLPNSIKGGNNTENDHVHRVYIQGSGAFRYDIFPGEVSIDDLVAANPFSDVIYLVDTQIQGSDFIKAFGPPNFVAGINDYKDCHNCISGSTLPSYVVSGSVEEDLFYEVYTADFDLNHVERQLAHVTNRSLSPVPMENDLTTGDLWLSFVKNEWVCDTNTDGDTIGVLDNSNWFQLPIFEIDYVVSSVHFALYSSVVISLVILVVLSLPSNSQSTPEKIEGGGDEESKSIMRDDKLDVYYGLPVEE